jgi:hypothetical protein
METKSDDRCPCGTLRMSRFYTLAGVKVNDDGAHGAPASRGPDARFVRVGVGQSGAV